MLLILNGPNLNQLGAREPSIYGTQALEALNEQCKAWGIEHHLTVHCRQSNYEGQLVEWIQTAQEEGFTGIILNAGALTHYSYALHDAILGQELPVIEVHLSQIAARDPFRHHSVIASVCRGSIAGFGFQSYYLALLSFVYSSKNQ